MNLNKVQLIGEKLRKIIERHGWRLYDTEGLHSELWPRVWPYHWEQMSKRGFAKKFKIDHTYLFVPIPKKNQTLKDAYYETTLYYNEYLGRRTEFGKTGIGPALLIKDRHDKKRWLIIRRTVFLAPRGLATFSNIAFYEKYVVVWTDDSHRTERDVVEMPYDTVVDTFRRYFRIITPEEFEKGQKETAMESGRALFATTKTFFEIFQQRKTK